MPNSSEGVVTVWRRSLPSTKVWASFQTRWNHMRRLHQGHWPESWTTQLKGYDGIYEMRLKVNRYQYRPLFIFGPNRGDITFVVMANEVGDEFVPKDALERAANLRVAVMNKWMKLNELEIA